jgi:N-acetylglutamate synthase-like GNAT family acetyltransferase/DNA-binding MarR family transcriptional regulator
LDIISELAELAFASRLKRLSERLMKDVSLLYKKLNVDFESRWFSLLFALNRKSPMSITELASALGLTHTAINQLASEMIQKNLINSTKGKMDERQRLLSISKNGRRVASSLSPVWEEIRLETKRLIEESGFDLLSAIGKIENRLDERNMYERVWFRLKKSLPGKLEILEYRPAWKKCFFELNQEWLLENFEMEETDLKLLSDPNGKIIRTGGAIFFARIENRIVGTCALIKHRDGILELAKLAVTKKFRRNGIGKKLVQAVIDRAKSMNVESLYLQTSTVLEAANSLYYKYGFRKVKHNPFGEEMYERLTFAMKINLINIMKN